MQPVEAAGDHRAERLEHGREAYVQRRWLDAHAALETADRVTPLGAPDLELLATAASMLGRDDEYLAGTGARSSRSPGAGRDAQGGPLRVLGRHAPPDPRRAGAWRGMARAGGAAGRTGERRLRGARIPARAGDDGAGGSRRSRGCLRRPRSQRRASRSASATPTCSPSPSISRAASCSSRAGGRRGSRCSTRPCSPSPPASSRRSSPGSSIAA